MYKRSGIILLCFVAILRVTKAVDNTIVSASEVTDEHVKLLSAIGPKEALPVISFATSEDKYLKYPLGLSMVKINEKGRLAAGTEFYTRTSAPQIFLCPDTNPEGTEKCLVPTQFEESADLQCEVEPTPTLEPHYTQHSCGPAGTGIGLQFGYKICPGHRPYYSYQSDRLIIYSICYDQPSKKNLFVVNEIVGAGMLSDKLLTRERDLNFDMNTETFGYIAEDYMAILKAKIESKPKYNVQQLVPTDDMALANWRKATQYFANFELQHIELIEPWNHVRGLLRAHAEKMLDQDFVTITGVFDIPKDQVLASVDENQIANFWVTLFIDFSPNSEEALVVVMNNFVAEHSNNRNDDAKTSNNNHDDPDHTKTSENSRIDYVETSEPQYIDKICGQDTCVDSLKQKFRNVGGQIRCCQINQNIWRLFMSEKQVLPENHIMRVAGINQCCEELSTTDSIPTNDCTHCVEL